MANNFRDRLKSFFGIDIKKQDNKKTIVPIENREDGKKGRKKYPPELQKLMNYWLSENFDTPETLKNRFGRYKDLDFAYYNNAIISMAVDLYADETIQADSQNNIITVFAKDKQVEKYIKDFFNRLNLNKNLLNSLSFEIALYGDHFWIPSITDAKIGIEKITPISPYNVSDRLEFNAIEVSKRKKRNSYYSKVTNRYKVLAKLADIISSNTDDPSKYFESQLFGFVLEDSIVLPPWNLVHFRRFSTKSEFYPFGRPLLINAISPFRQLQSSKNLMELARAMSFPMKHYKVKTSDDMREIDKWESVNEAREEYHNLANTKTSKEEGVPNSEIWTPEDLLDVEIINSSVDLNDIKDIELLQDNLIMATRIPKGYLITDKGSWGVSGQSLLQQSKMFGRSVYSNQSTILAGLIELVRLQFLITGHYDYDTEFELMMNFPVVEEDNDRIRTKSDTLRLATDTIDAVSSAMGLERGEALPKKVITDIFSTLSFLDSDDVKKWTKEIEKQQQEQTIEENKKIETKIKKRFSESIVRDCYFQVKNRMRLKEGKMVGKHYLCSTDLDVQKKCLYDLMMKETNKKLKG